MVEISSSIEGPEHHLDNQETIRKGLEKWMQTHLHPSVELPSFQLPEENGMSNVTLVFDALINGQKQSFVARIEPQGEKLLFPSYDLPLQCELMKLVAEFSEAPVPEIVGIENDPAILGVPFYLMKKNEGLIPSDIPPYHMDGWFMNECSTEQRAAMWNAGIDGMAQVNTIDISQPGAKEVIDNLAICKNLTEQLDYWEHFYRWGFGWLQHKTVEKTLSWLQENKLPEQTIRLCWGDSRIPNVIFNHDKQTLAALIDWEMATLGDPLQDIAWWIYMDELFTYGLSVEPLSGIPSRMETAQYWAQQTGFSIDQLHYYLVFAGLRFAIILGRILITKDLIEHSDQFDSSFETVYLNKIFEKNN